MTFVPRMFLSSDEIKFFNKHNARILSEKIFRIVGIRRRQRKHAVVATRLTLHTLILQHFETERER